MSAIALLIAMKISRKLGLTNLISGNNRENMCVQTYHVQETPCMLQIARTRYDWQPIRLQLRLSIRNT
jgi:hypothetical protein